MGRARARDDRGDLNRGEPISRRELVLLVAVLLAGSVLRIAAVGRSAVEHFDEGVYASNIFFPPPDYAYPLRRFFAPPLVPAVIEACLTAGMLVGLPPNAAALLPGLIAGCLTIAALWWVGRSWVSPRAGIATAALAAFCPFHIAYSATALTDVLMGLWLVLAVDAAARSLTTHDFRWAVGAGLYTGLAWWTKYNGWLPLAIEGAGIGVLAVLSTARTTIVGFRSAKAISFRGARGDNRTVIRRAVLSWGSEAGGRGSAIAGRIGYFAVTTLVAVLVISPYVLMLQTQGGYGPIAANHAKYVVGFGGWLNSAGRHIASFAVMDRGWTTVAVVAAVALAAVTTIANGDNVVRSAHRRFAWLVVVAAGGAVASWLAGGLLSLAVLSAGGLLMKLARLLREPPSGERPGRAEVGWSLLVAWWGGLLVATPCYWPYPRLLVPWLAAAWLGAGAFVNEFLELWYAAPEIAATTSAARRHRSALCGAYGVALLAAMVVAHFFRPAPGVSRSLAFDRLSIKDAADQLRTDLKSWRGSDESATTGAVPRVVYVLGEPALFFQLCITDESLVRPVQELVTTSATMDGRPLPTYLVVGPHAQRDPGFSESWAAAEKHLTLVAAHRFRPSPIVRLDSHDPPRQLDAALQMESEVRVYEIPPGAIGSFNP